MVNSINHGDSLITTRGSKRSISPDQSSLFKRKCKLTKIHSQENVGNKENLIKRVQSEMILSKNSTLLFVNKKKTDLIEKPWHETHRLWLNMLSKTLDKTYEIHSNYLSKHPLITTKMRSILFDWLIEVCEVYHLHRETYHLAIAYIDQYLSKTDHLAKTKFQLLGITALFVAAKLEEIYPPHLADFAYVTDETCSEENILQMEIELMNTLNWYINPITSISWILIYLQSENDFLQTRLTNEYLQTWKLSHLHQSNDFLRLFSSVVRLIDLCSLDIEYSHFSKHILAASAILFYKPTWPIEQLTNIHSNEFYRCQEWMKSFYEILNQTNNSEEKFSTISNDEFYSIQKHNISIDLLDLVYEYREKFSVHMETNRPFRDLINHIPSIIRLTKQNSIHVLV